MSNVEGERGRVAEGNGWSQYQRLVLDKLEHIDQRLTALEEAQVLVRIDVAKLNVKAGLWGGLAGFIPASLIVVVNILNGGH